MLMPVQASLRHDRVKSMEWSDHFALISQKRRKSIAMERLLRSDQPSRALISVSLLFSSTAIELLTQFPNRPDSPSTDQLTTEPHTTHIMVGIVQTAAEDPREFKDTKTALAHFRENMDVRMQEVETKLTTVYSDLVYNDKFEEAVALIVQEHRPVFGEGYYQQNKIGIKFMSKLFKEKIVELKSKVRKKVIFDTWSATNIEKQSLGTQIEMGIWWFAQNMCAFTLEQSEEYIAAADVEISRLELLDKKADYDWNRMCQLGHHQALKYAAQHR